MKQDRPPLSAEALSSFCWRLSLLCKAGIPSAQSVAVLQEDAGAGERALLSRLRGRLEEGVPLSQALGQCGAFPAYLLRMLEIGESSGRLDQVLAALAAYYRRQAELEAAARRAVTYPAVMAALIAVVFLVLVARVLPVFDQVFRQMGVALSPAGAVLLAVGSWGKYAALALAVLLAGLAVYLALRTRKGTLDGLFLRGKTARLVAQGRFASAMSLMLCSGLPLDEAMHRTAALLADSPLAGAVGLCQSRMEQGEAFPQAAIGCGLVTGLHGGLLTAGFRAGALEQAMEEVSVRCQEETDQRLERSLSAFEYGLVVVLCLAVALVLLSVMLPLLGVLSALGG